MWRWCKLKWGEFVSLISKSSVKQLMCWSVGAASCCVSCLTGSMCVCLRDEGAVSGAEQVWSSHSGVSTHFCSVATPIDSHSFSATLAHPPTAGRCDCSSLDPPPPSLSLCFTYVWFQQSCFWFWQWLHFRLSHSHWLKLFTATPRRKLLALPQPLVKEHKCLQYSENTYQLTIQDSSATPLWPLSCTLSVLSVAL